MAFECGALGRSGGRSHLAALEELLAHLEAEDEDVSRGEIKEGEGWAATRLRIRRPGEPELEQYLQVSVGGEILEIYLEDAAAALAPEALAGRDLMLTTTLSGTTDPVVNDRILTYALDEWDGVLWDETSGFTSS
ncbi:hypothetical protein [Streptomyces sp. BK205]|uniref:hypothetical protein n=1 Tax=Streptomyces sp. BK205 TaxID=2512164 RepID=UPI00104DC2D0|nr:hypothetical protein [Streptomyces sp. BK205]TCR15517.1 hypothetical protein EV578_117214 [Streptomyces sp. BK205]